ncbi:MAG: hypothetical protein CL843_03790 [Crocinitomicaceae bacterium]|nr:hypothetical protein [Crocinitomicaceae bacterium]|tara:strand:- start:3187 stop:4059 length:873 start_codon:yes stop_codon:yes gene_type:complete
MTSTAKSQEWKKYRHELGGAIGIANYMGDLGGLSEEANPLTNYQFSNSRPALGISYRFRIIERLSLRTNVLYARLFADDATANSDSRKNRNLNFRTSVYEISTQLEYYFFKERIGFNYISESAKNPVVSPLIAAYFFGGIGGFFFNPEGKTEDGDWEKLADLDTEGQGLPGGPSDYSSFSVAIPLGIGIKYILNDKWSIGIEYGLRYTFTDYLDDVSGNYYSNSELLLQEKGALALSLSDKRVSENGNPSPTRYNGKGARGNSDRMDAYMFSVITVNYRLKTGKQKRSRF